MALEVFGDVESDGLSCRTMKLADGGIDKVRASFNDTEKAITGIRYFKDLRYVDFGDMDGNE